MNQKNECLSDLFQTELKKQYELELKDIDSNIKTIENIYEQFLFTDLAPLINETIILYKQFLKTKKEEYVAKFPTND